jgi:chemotaxis receptor (MCP) glutamine deamidase CheD
MAKQAKKQAKAIGGAHTFELLAKTRFGRKNYRNEYIHPAILE